MAGGPVPCPVLPNPAGSAWSCPTLPALSILAQPVCTVNFVSCPNLRFTRLILLQTIPFYPALPCATLPVLIHPIPWTVPPAPALALPLPHLTISYTTLPDQSLPAVPCFFPTMYFIALFRFTLACPTLPCRTLPCLVLPYCSTLSCPSLSNLSLLWPAVTYPT